MYTRGVNTFDFSVYAPQRMFLIQGDDSVFDELARDLIVKDPMIQALSVPRFTIEHAQNVAEFAIEGTGEARTFLIHFSVFSPEAAQVLLKSLEEPDENTIIIFITRYPYLIPQTVRSRLMLLAENGKIKIENKKIKNKILEEIKKEALEKDDDPATRRSRAVILLDDLEIVTKGERTNSEIIYGAKKMLFKANMPTKFVLDYVTTVIR